MQESRKRILESAEIKAKIERIAHEINESYFTEKQVVLVGISGRGFDFAKRLKKLLDKIAENEYLLAKISLDKDTPLKNDILINPPMELKNKAVLLVDDVLNSGKTLAYGAAYLLQLAPKSLKTVILVNREHHRYPITADFVGLSLATTLKEHIAVEFGKSDGVYLV